MTSEALIKPAGKSPHRDRLEDALLYASRRFNNNKLSCLIVTLVLLLLGCMAMLPPILTDNNFTIVGPDGGLLDGASPSDLLAKLKEMVAAKDELQQSKVKESAGHRFKSRGNKGKRNKHKNKIEQEEETDNEEQEGEENDDTSDDYGEMTAKINKQAKKDIRKNFKLKYTDTGRVWQANSGESQTDDEEQNTNKKRGKNKGKGKNRKRIRYTEDVPFELSANWTAEDSAREVALMKDRVNTVSSVCETITQQEHFAEQKLDRLLYNMRWVLDHDMVYCPIFKAASTTWMKNLLEMAQVKMNRGQFHAKTRELYPQPEDPEVVKQFLQGAMKLIIVRHPLDRILSAYRDKMRRILPKKGDPYKDMQQEISRQFPDPELPETVDVAPVRPTTAGQPTFNQFLLKITDDVSAYWNRSGRAQVNLHWRPYWATCSPCSFSYTAIAKVETLERDQEWIIRDRGLEGIALNAKTHSSNFDQFNTTKEATEAYFSRVPRSMLEEVVRLYQPDFDLFDYSPDYHLSLTIPGI